MVRVLLRLLRRLLSKIGRQQFHVFHFVVVGVSIVGWNVLVLCGLGQKCVVGAFVIGVFPLVVVGLCVVWQNVFFFSGWVLNVLCVVE